MMKNLIGTAVSYRDALQLSKSGAREVIEENILGKAPFKSDEDDKLRFTKRNFRQRHSSVATDP